MSGDPLPPARMPPDTPLDTLETEIAHLQAALLGADPTAVEQQAQAVRSAITALADWLAKTPANSLPPATRQRAQQLGAQLGTTRDQLARAMALTSQQAGTLLPPVDPVTYGPNTGNKARIYRAPG